MMWKIFSLLESLSELAKETKKTLLGDLDFGILSMSGIPQGVGNESSAFTYFRL